MGIHFLAFVPQLHQRDCAVAALAMLLDISYENALHAFRHNVVARGATVSQIRKAAERVGRTLLLRRRVDLEHDTGILCIRSLKWADDHLGILKEGIIVDTDGTLWDADVYLATYEAKVLSLLSTQEK